MAKVHEPKFDSTIFPGSVKCEECPFIDSDGNVIDELCASWGKTYNTPCPTIHSYRAACELAEQEAQ